MKWNELADAIIKLWNGVGMWACLGGGVLALAWKALDAWSKRGKP